VPYTRQNFFAGETFIDLDDCRQRGEIWSRETAGMRIHGTTQCRPIEAFRVDELPRLLPLPGSPFDIPHWSEPKLHRDFHAEVDRALYSAPHRFVGQRLKARRDSTTVKLYVRGELIKVHPRREPGQRSTDAADYPTGKEIYATRDVDKLKFVAGTYGEAIGHYATALLDTPLPWTKMRQVYRLLGLVKKWGPGRVDLACSRALEAEAVDVNLVSRMLDRAREDLADSAGPSRPIVAQGRFARDASEFATSKQAGR
jgi:hypothetical protein